MFIMIIEPDGHGSNEWCGWFGTGVGPGGETVPVTPAYVKTLHMTSGTAPRTSGHANFGFSDGHVEHYWTDDPMLDKGYDETKYPPKWKWNGSVRGT